MAEWVLAVERAYVAAETGTPRTGTSSPENTARAYAAIGAVASHYLAVGTPRSFGLVVDDATLDDAALSLAAHRTWFAPIDLRCAGGTIAGMRETSLKEALACDIVCVHARVAVEARDIRRGTHLNFLRPEGVPLLDELERIADITREQGLGALAAGFVDGRQLDEITLFIAGDAAIALAALG